MLTDTTHEIAREIEAILDYKAKAQEQIVSRAGRLYRFANAKRREEKKAVNAEKKETEGR